jgi:pilus assembly protein CpaB
MSARTVLLVLGVVFVIAGLWLSVVWIRTTTGSAARTAQPVQNRPARLVALHALPSGTLLREGDFGWKEIAEGEARPGQLLRGQVSDTQYLGAITRRVFAEGEPLVVSELVKPGDRRFLAAVLQPGRRAVSISVDAPQSSSGLVLPGDYVDVILTQNFGDNLASIAHRSSGETVLRNVRVVAVDQSLGMQVKPGEKETHSGGDSRLPKTITLEVDERQAEALFVAAQLGKLQLAVRPLESSGARAQDRPPPRPIWASDVSQAVEELGGLKAMQMASRRIAPKATGARATGSTLENNVRYPPQ